MNFTVLLLYPDYMASDFGQETYMAWVTADTVAEAEDEAKQSAFIQADGAANDPDDFLTLAVFHGWLDDVKEML